MYKRQEFYTLPQEKRGYPVWFDTAEQTSVFYKNEQNVYGLANIVTLGIAVYAPCLLYTSVNSRIIFLTT